MVHLHVLNCHSERYQAFQLIVSFVQHFRHARMHVNLHRHAATCSPSKLSDGPTPTNGSSYELVKTNWADALPSGNQKPVAIGLCLIRQSAARPIVCVHCVRFAVPQRPNGNAPEIRSMPRCGGCTPLRFDSALTQS
jgi:hypothetical protein